MENSKKGLISVQYGLPLFRRMSPQTLKERQRMEGVPYVLAVGSLMYAMLCMSLDIAYAMSVTSRYQSDPDLEHWVAMKHIRKYL